MSVSPAPVGLDELPPVCEWPVVELDGERWHVAPVYLAPVSRGEAVALADDWGCEVPSRALVDAIWQAADLRLDPHRITRDWSSPRDMVAYGAQRMRIEAAIGGRPFTLLAGSHKDLAYVDGYRVDLYGWHRLDGVPIERGRTSHGPAYVDYSQGLRLVRRCA